MAVGDEALVRRVLLAWSIRSARLLQQVNIEEWLKQESASDDSMTRFSEMTTSSSMYTTRRLRLLGQAAHEAELMRWSQSIQPVRKKLAPVPGQATPGLGVGTVKAVKVGAAAGAARPTVPSVGAVQAGAGGPVGATQMAGGASNGAAVPANATQGATRGSGPQPDAAANPAVAAAPTDSIRVICNKCHAAMRVPLAVLRGKTMLNVRCPQCHIVMILRPRAATPAAGATAGSAAAPAAQAATPAAVATRTVAPPAATASVAPKSVAPPATASGAPQTPVAPLTMAHGAATKAFAAKAGAGKHAAVPPARAGGKK
jgi:Meckel syndrome type 1 protein